MRPEARAILRAALLEAAPWLARTDVGPQTVDAGVCERCRRSPRLVATCGPIAFPALCGRCLTEAADDAWCDGHRADGIRARAWIASLPDRYEDAVVLWWVATGEIRPETVIDDQPGRFGSELGPRVRRALADTVDDPGAAD